MELWLRRCRAELILPATTFRRLSTSSAPQWRLFIGALKLLTRTKAKRVAPQTLDDVRLDAGATVDLLSTLNASPSLWS